jgi:RNA polymerase sigma factor (sigma-70 family)
VSDETTQLAERDRADMIRLIAGQDSALNDLMEHHSEKLFHYLIRCLQNEDDAADLSQETFVRVYQQRNKFDTRQKFSTWLYAIASNLVRDYYRRYARHPQVSLNATIDDANDSFGETLSDQKPSPSENLQTEERADAVRRAVAELPEELRVPLILAEYGERSQVDIGEILGCTAKAVETRIYRARQQLRAKLNKLLA